MTPPARMQAAIDLLDEIIGAACDNGPAADTLIARYFKTRRYAGSGDRRAVRELAYAAIRRSGERPASGRAAMVGLAREREDLAPSFDGSAHGPAPIAPDEAGSAAKAVPHWLHKKLRTTLDDRQIAALLDRAPLDLRVNTARATREEVLAAFPEAVQTAHAPHGVRFAEPVAIERHPLFEAGVIEVQDEGSQLIALACRAGAGETVVDLCAGAGGKTLAIAAGMEGGRLIATDTDRGRLARLVQRAERAGAGGIETRLLDPGEEMAGLGDLEGRADVVLIDAPCSGSGTWRRNPEARWRLTPDRLARVVTLQARLLDIGARLVRPDGRLVYAVCSLLDEEGADQLMGFLGRHAGWTSEPPFAMPGRDRGAGKLLAPVPDGTDGFFVARVKRP